MALSLEVARKMSTGKQLVRNLIILVMMVLFFLFFQNIYIFPKQAKIEETKEVVEKISEEISTLHLKVDDKRRRADKEAEVLETYRKMEAQVDGAKRMLPTRENVSDLLDILTEPVKRTKVSMLSLLPFPPVDAPDMTKISYRIQLQGRFQNIGRYIQEISNMDRLITVDNIQLIKNEADEPDIQAQLLVSTYLLREDK